MKSFNALLSFEKSTGRKKKVLPSFPFEKEMRYIKPVLNFKKFRTDTGVLVNDYKIIIDKLISLCYNIYIIRERLTGNAENDIQFTFKTAANIP